MNKAFSILLFIFVVLTSCSNDTNELNDTNTTVLEGVWYKENDLTKTKLTFTNNTFKIQSGNLQLLGTFEIKNDTITGNLKGQTGVNSTVVSPVNFKGLVKIKNQRVDFSNFNGRWINFFSSWYQKDTSN